MIKNRRCFLVLVALVASTLAGYAQPAPDTGVADLIRAGKIRVGLFPPQYVKDPASGELKSTWVEIARELAARIGVQLVLVEHPTPPKAVACLMAGACDMLFLPLDARAANVGDFSPPIFQFDYTLLVPASSSIHSVADADRKGVRIAGVRNHASTMTLNRILKQAEMVLGDSPPAVFKLLRSGQADALASTRPLLLNFSSKLPGSRVLVGRYGANLNRMVVPKGKAGWLTYISAFVEEAKASGLVQKAIDRAGPRGIKVAPPGDPK